MREPAGLKRKFIEILRQVPPRTRRALAPVIFGMLTFAAYKIAESAFQWFYGMDNPLFMLASAVLGLIAMGVSGICLFITAICIGLLLIGEILE